jgi:nitroreductase
MDVFKAVSSRISCRHFLDQHVDPDIVRRLVDGAANAASSSNLQPWNVYAVTGEPLKEIKRQALDAIEKRDWRTLETEYPDMPENLYLGPRPQGLPLHRSHSSSSNNPRCRTGRSVVLVASSVPVFRRRSPCSG